MAHLALWIYVWRRNKRLQITTLEVRGWGRGDGRVLSWVENHLGSPVHHPAITRGVEASAQKMSGGVGWGGGRGGKSCWTHPATKNAANNSKSGQIYSARAKWTHIPLLLNDLCVPNYTIIGLIVWRPNGNTCSVLFQDEICSSSSTLKQYRQRFTKPNTQKNW